MRVRVVTDSSTNVPDSYLDRLKIIEMPALVNFDGQSFRNKVDISAEEFYRRLAATDKLPTTAQPSPQQFAIAYEGLAAAGAEDVIAVVVSGKMSGTLNSATVAAENAPLKVHLWDSQNAALGAGWQAIAAAEMAQDGLDATAILAELAGIRARMQTLFTPATLRNLIASGRAPRLKGNIGEVLDIKPILAMLEGMLEPAGQARGRRRATGELLNRISETVGDKPVRVGVGHADIPAEAAQFAEVVRGRLNVAELITTDVGPVLATLGGPGLLALCVYTL